MFVESTKVARVRNSNKDIVSFDDDNVFWMKIEDEYFGKIDDRMRDILKFHIHSSQYILNIIKEYLKNSQEKDWNDFVFASMTLMEGLIGWNRISRELNGEGFGLFDNNGELNNTMDGNFRDSFKEESRKVLELDDYEIPNDNGKRIKSINLTLSIPPLSKPTDFPRELTHCKSLREILHNLIKIQCSYKYTKLSNTRNLYSILDIKEDEENLQENNLNGTCNYICLIPDIITGPNVEWKNNWKELDQENLIYKEDNYYNFNDFSDEWIFNINNKISNLELRRSLLDTSHLLDCNIYYKKELKEENKNDKRINENVLKSSGGNKIKSILGTGENLKENEQFRMNPEELVPLFNLQSKLDEEENTTISKIKRVKSFGDFFQDNLHISPNKKLVENNLETIDNSESISQLNTDNKFGYLNLSSIMNSDKKIDFQVNNTLNNDYIFQDYEQRYLNRQKDKELRELSISLIKRLGEISSLKMDLFQKLLTRVENERRPNLNYWNKKEYELSDYYRRKQYDIGYNYTLERQSRDLEKFRLACIDSKYLPNEWQETALCSICGNDTDWDEDPIYFCDGCYQPAHHSCVNPKQPFRYNSTRMLNVLERERKCQQGDLDSSNLNKEKENEVDEDDQWLCDVCLNIKNQCLDHQYLFFGIIRMICGPRDKETINQAIQSIQKNVNPFLSQLVAYNVISSSIKDQSFTDPIIFPWISDWVFPEITQDDLQESSQEESNKVIITERRKGRPRKTPLLSLTSLNKNSFRYFTLNFSNTNTRNNNEMSEREMINNIVMSDIEEKDKEEKKQNDDDDDEIEIDFDFQDYNNHHFEWVPTYQIPYNFANLEIFKRQIFNPVKWYNKQESIRRANQTPPPVYYSGLESNIVTENEDFVMEKSRNARYTTSTSLNINNTQLFQIFKHDEEIIKQLKEKGVVKYDLQNNSYKVKIKVPICQLCGYDAYCRSGGIMKKTVDGFWAHIRCALGNASVLSSDGNYLRIRVDLQRNKIKCQGCGKIDSSPILCHNQQCCNSYHINCASSRNDCIVDWENSKPLLYCPEHSFNIAPTILLRRYQLGNFNKWYNQRFQQLENNFSIFGNIFTLPIIVRQTFLADLRDDTRTLIFLTRLFSKSQEIQSKMDENLSVQIVFNGFSKFHLYMPELVDVQCNDTVLSRLITPWSGEIVFWKKLIIDQIFNSFGISDLYQLNQYKYLDNSRIIISCIFGIMELLLNRIMNPYEIRLITLMISSKMGFGPWFSFFYYWKFIPLTFYYNIIKCYKDLSLYEPKSYIYLLNTGINNELQQMNNNINYHLNLFGLKNLSIEGLHKNEAYLKSINSCSSIISQNWNYSCQLCGYHIILSNNSLKKNRDQLIINVNEINNDLNFKLEEEQVKGELIVEKMEGYLKIPYLLKCQICNVVICSICNNLYQYGLICQVSNNNNSLKFNKFGESYCYIKDDNQLKLINMNCQRCIEFEKKEFENVMIESSCCLCTRFDGILLPLKKGTQIDFTGVKTRRTLLVDGSIPLDDQFRLIFDIWIHPVCLEWLVMSKVQVFSLNNVILIDKKHFGNICKYCGFSNGATVSCALSTCDVHFHVSCGRSIGCKFDSSRIKSKQNDHYYSVLNNGGTLNMNSSGGILSGGVYRRAWCISHNQCNNNNNNNNSGINKSLGGLVGSGGGLGANNMMNNGSNLVTSLPSSSNYSACGTIMMGSSSSSLQDLSNLRILYNNIKIQNNNELVNFELNQNLETNLKISLLSYYGLILSLDQRKRLISENFGVNNNNNNNNQTIDSGNPLFISKNHLNSTNSPSSDDDIVYINKWEDLIQILVYEIVSRFVYGIGIPKQKRINFSKTQRRRNNNNNNLIQEGVGNIYNNTCLGVKLLDDCNNTKLLGSLTLSRMGSFDNLSNNGNKVVIPKATLATSTSVLATSALATSTSATLATSTSTSTSTSATTSVLATSATNNVQNECPACDKIYKRDWQQVCLDWIYCDLCNNWYHWYCLGLNKENIPSENEPFHCLYCLEVNKGKRSGRKKKKKKNSNQLNETIITIEDNNKNKSSFEDLSSSLNQNDMTIQLQPKVLEKEKLQEVDQTIILAESSPSLSSSSLSSLLSPSSSSSSSSSSSISSLASLESSQSSSSPYYSRYSKKKSVRKKSNKKSRNNRNKRKINQKGVKKKNRNK